MKKKRAVRFLAIVLALLMPTLSAVIALAAPNDVTSAGASGEKYISPDINELTGHGKEPEELSVSAGATYQEKAWYEYITYSDKAVSSYRLDDDSRLLFYDPYTYTNAMVMDVQFDANTTEFDTMSSYMVSKTTSKTMTACTESTFTTSSATQTSGKDEYGTTVTNGGYTHTKYNYDEIHSTDGTVEDKTNYGYKKYKSEDLTITGTQSSATGLKIKVGGVTLGEGETNETITIGATEGRTYKEAWLQDEVTKETTYKGYKSTTTHDYEYDVEDHTTSKTEGWEQLSARVTKTTGSSRSTSDSWSETEGTTTTKTYAATHFASDGVTPLPWAIVHYSVQMPMKCCLQVKYEGEWVTLSTVYCLLTTVQGTCRAWMQNGQVYYEDWGSGEPVVETQFWSQFMTREQLMNAYSNKLYPVGGED